jgi:hypothetical protein
MPLDSTEDGNKLQSFTLKEAMSHSRTIPLTMPYWDRDTIYSWKRVEHCVIWKLIYLFTSNLAMNNGETCPIIFLENKL